MPDLSATVDIVRGFANVLVHNTTAVHYDVISNNTIVEGDAQLQGGDPWDTQHKTFTPLFHNVFGFCIVLLFFYYILPSLSKCLRSPAVQR